MYEVDQLERKYRNIVADCHFCRPTVLMQGQAGGATLSGASADKGKTKTPLRHEPLFRHSPGTIVAISRCTVPAVQLHRILAFLTILVWRRVAQRVHLGRPRRHVRTRSVHAAIDCSPRATSRRQGNISRGCGKSLVLPRSLDGNQPMIDMPRPSPRGPAFCSHRAVSMLPLRFG